MADSIAQLGDSVWFMATGRFGLPTQITLRYKPALDSHYVSPELTPRLPMIRYVLIPTDQWMRLESH